MSGEKAVTTKNYMDVEDRGQNLEVGGRKSEVGREGFSCGSGFQPRSYDLNEFNDLPLTGIWMQDEVSASMFFFLTPDTCLPRRSSTERRGAPETLIIVNRRKLRRPPKSLR